MKKNKEKRNKYKNKSQKRSKKEVDLFIKEIIIYIIGQRKSKTKIYF